MRFGQGTGLGDGYSLRKGFSPRKESEAKRGDFDLFMIREPLSSHLRLLAKKPFKSTNGKSERRATGSGSLS